MGKLSARTAYVIHANSLNDLIHIAKIDGGLASFKGTLLQLQTILKNIYVADGTLTANRIVSMGTNKLVFENGNISIVEAGGTSSSVEKLFVRSLGTGVDLVAAHLRVNNAGDLIVSNTEARLNFGAVDKVVTVQNLETLIRHLVSVRITTALGDAGGGAQFDSTTATIQHENNTKSININTGNMFIQHAALIRISSAILEIGSPSGVTALLKLYNSTNNNFITIQSGITSAGYTLTLPTAQGASNTILKNNGSGVLSWDTPTVVGAYRTVFIAAGSMVPRITNGAQGITGPETATNKITFDYLLFDGTTPEFAQITHQMPDEWDLGAVKVKFYWEPTSAAVGDVVWGIKALSLGDGILTDTAFGAEVNVTDSTIANSTNRISVASSDVTFSATPLLGKLAIFEISRRPDLAGDTLNGVDVKLIGVSIQYKELTTNPAAWVAGV